MKAVILGVGNILLTDEAAGVRAAEKIQQMCDFGDDVQVLDGGTAGMELLESLSDLDALIILDAVHTGDAPGTVIQLEGEKVPGFFRNRISPHQLGISDVLAMLQLTGQAPRHLVLIGVVPESMDTGVGLTPCVEQRIPEMVNRALTAAADCGLTWRPREAHPQGVAGCA
ncbi:MAG: HyaD/HybD family hydrogenase maturation endopeptidase [Gammaproteobacteria bacterium]|nr:MAG: HyaD/HybD family hydrogenase maturation endopeptidase [Gammaproteobacteria bacterium]